MGRINEDICKYGRCIFEVCNLSIYVDCSNFPLSVESLTSRVIVKKSSFGLQECASRENRLEAIECLVGFISGLIQFLATMNLENKGHDVLWKRLRDLFQLVSVSLHNTEHT